MNSQQLSQVSPRTAPAAAAAELVLTLVAEASPEVDSLVLVAKSVVFNSVQMCL